MDKKLGVIVPYRDRYEHLQMFKQSIIPYLKDKGIDFELIVVEQDDSSAFNRGKLLNVGFLYAKKIKCDYVVFHDVDMLPIDVDYSYSDVPIQMATNFVGETNRVIFDGYFGGVTMFPIDSFEHINGYSNDYWGWGAEDDDVMFRCVAKEIKASRKNGRYRSLSHERNITQDLYNENLRKFFGFKNNLNLDTINQKIDSDGLTTLKYEVLEEKKISTKATLVKVRI